jgi:DNA-binding response OmpR family regulator
VKGFKSGADLVLVPPLEACELAAAGDNLARRLDRREISAAVPIRRESENWKLDRIAWELVAPGGKAIHLTAGEFRFISCLVETPGLPVTRSAIAAALGHVHRTYDPRRLDAVVRRLRRKAEALVGSVLPLRAAHASGYVFTAAVTVI